MVKESYSFGQKADIRNSQGSDFTGIDEINTNGSTNGNLKKGKKSGLFIVNDEKGDLHNFLMLMLDQARGYKTFSYSTQLSTKFILLIIVKMPTIVGISMLISMINTTSERLKAKNFFICWYFSFNEQLKFHA